MNSLHLFLFWFIKLVFCQIPTEVPNNNQTIRYKLVQTTPNYLYETSIHEENVITSVEKAFSIEILRDFPVLGKGMLDIEPETFYFWMDHHNLQRIEPGAFDNQNITEAIRLEGNQLSKIEKATFKNLKLKRIFLDYNKIVEIEEGALENLPNLQEFSVTRNLLVIFHPNSVINTPNLQFLGLSFNKLKSLQANLFKFLTKNGPAMIGLGPNEIETIDPKAFEGITISNLNLTNNKLKDIPSEIFVDNELYYLDLGNNLLTSLPDSVYEQKKLEDAVFTGNPFTCETVAKLKKLSEQFGTVLIPWGGIERRIVKYDSNNCE